VAKNKQRNKKVQNALTHFSSMRSLRSKRMSLTGSVLMLTGMSW